MGGLHLQAEGADQGHTLAAGDVMRARRAPFAEQKTKVEAVLRKYATDMPPGVNAIPYSFLIPELSRWIVVRGSDAPRTISRAKTSTKLIRTKEAAAALLTDLLEDPSLAVAFTLEDRLAIARVAYLDVDLKEHRGSPPKQSAKWVARFLAEQFEGLTGSPPTRITRLREGIAQPSNGRFVECLAEVYDALQIEASAESQAKTAIKAMEKSRSQP